MNRFLPFKIIAICFCVAFVSCSKDGDEPSQSETTIIVSDFSKTVSENPENGTLIGNIAASTNNGTLAFSLVEQSPEGALYLDAASGALKVADETLFDFETNPIITGTVKVINGEVSKTVLITITLNDLEEENIYEGSIELKSQQDVDDFGANNYTRITGAMILGSVEDFVYSNISDLSPLQSIRKVDYSLLISHNPNLNSISSLTVSEVGSQLAIVENATLTTLQGLENITSLPFGLFLYGNEQLADASQLGGLREIGSLVLINCPKISNLAFLSNITSLKNININACNSLKNLEGLNNLETLVGEYPEIKFINNSSLENLNGLRNLNASVHTLQIDGNEKLITLQGLENISPYQNLYIARNNSLQDLEGLKNVTNIAYVQVVQNATLTNILGLNNLHHAFDLLVENNNALSSLDGLENLTDCNLMTARSNTNLSNFCALQNLVLEDNSVSLNIIENAYNPTKQDIIDGNCSL